MDEPLDCLIVGGGPAGLTAAIYLARFHLDILVVDDGKGRAESIHCTHNHAGYPDGISGKELVRLMREQALVAALESGERSRERLLGAAWSDVPQAMRAVAAFAMQAHLEKLAAEGVVDLELLVD